MYSYIVGCIAVLIVFSNPISQLLWPTELFQHNAPRRTERPRLNESLIAIEDTLDGALECPPDRYQTRILSREPLVLYIGNFFSEEIESLLELSTPLFEPSTITNDGASTHSGPSVRLSDVALLPRTLACAASRPAPARSRAGGETCGSSGCAPSATLRGGTMATTLTGALGMAGGGA